MNRAFQFVVAIAVLSLACLAQECKPGPKVGPNCMKIPAGFVHEEGQGIDTTIGEIKGHGLLIRYDLNDLPVLEADLNKKIDCKVPVDGDREFYFLRKKLTVRGESVCYWLEYKPSDKEEALCDVSDDDDCEKKLLARHKRQLRGWLEIAINEASFYAEVNGHGQIKTVLAVVLRYIPAAPKRPVVSRRN